MTSFLRHRKQIMEIDNVLLWLAMEFEKQTNLINELERVRAIHGSGQSTDGNCRYLHEQKNSKVLNG